MKSTQRITILGGGTSAWLTAAYLSKKLPQDYFKICVIEGKSPNIIGVGESTLPHFPKFMEECGFNIKDWFDFCECTHKAGVSYKDWVKPNTHFWHPFGFAPIFPDDSNLFDLLNHLKVPKHKIPHYFNSYKQSIIEKKVPSKLQAVHVSASKLVNFIKQHINIETINEDIIDINYKGEDIFNLLLSSQTSHTSDLFIDCLGFNSIIKEKNKSYNFKDCSDRDPLNAAVFNPSKYSSPNADMFPYTEAQCTPHGWIWKIPLQNSVGAGMVFNKHFLSKDQAIKYYEDYWGKENLLNPQTKYVEFTPGYYTNQWNGNVISIGLATGFIEPLEATGVQLIIEGIEHAFEGFSKGWYTKEDVNLFNSILNSKYSSTFDFISLHYLNTQHKSPFWNYIKDNIKITKSLEYRLNYFKNYLISPLTKEKTQLFSYHSWHYTIIQFLGILPKTKKVFLETPNLYLEEFVKSYD